MAADPQKLNDPERVRKLMENAERLGELDLAKRSRIRLFELAGAGFSEPLERKFWETIAAYEELLTRKNGRKTKAARTRLMVTKKGFKAALIDWTLSPAATEGFEQLVADGLGQYAGEHIVVEFADQFDANVVAAATARLKLHNIAMPDAHHDADAAGPK
jgi:hypothetical protein